MAIHIKILTKPVKPRWEEEWLTHHSSGEQGVNLGLLTGPYPPVLHSQKLVPNCTVGREAVTQLDSIINVPFEIWESQLTSLCLDCPFSVKIMKFTNMKQSQFNHTCAEEKEAIF